MIKKDQASIQAGQRQIQKKRAASIEDYINEFNAKKGLQYQSTKNADDPDRKVQKGDAPFKHIKIARPSRLIMREAYPTLDKNGTVHREIPGISPTKERLYHGPPE